jgi:hypothetical protein
VNAIYQKSICVLHRKYVTEGRLESIQRCYDAATDLVKRFVDVYGEFEPGGQLEMERWFRGSITWHDFLLGCTALSLTVCSTKSHVFGRPAMAIVDITTSLELLRSAEKVIEQHTFSSKDSRKAQTLIKAVVLQFANQDKTLLDVVQTQLGGGQNLVSHSNLPVTGTPSSWENDGLWEDTALMPVDDPAWTYMQQFLDLPDGDPFIST